MKKITLLILFSAFILTLRAQEFLNTPDFRLGLTTSPTLGWIKPEAGKGDGLSLGFSYGLLADFNFAPNYSFATGLLITTVNGKSIEPGVQPYQSAYNETKNFEIKYMMQYIDIPLTVKLKTSLIGDMRWYGQFGLSNGFKIGARQNVQTGTQGLADNVKAGSDTNFYRAGLILGGGTEFEVSPQTSITAGLSFNNGFTKLSSSRSVKNHYISLNFAVYF